MNKFAIVVLMILSHSQKALAINVSSETSRGSFTFEEDLNIDGDFEEEIKEEKKDDKKEDKKDDKKKAKKDEREKWVWSLEYTYTQTFSNEAGATPNSSILIVDEATELDLSTGGEKDGSYTYGGGVDYSTTPEESLKDYGPNIYGSKTYDLGKNKPSDDDDFTPNVTFKLTLEDLSFVQTFFGNLGPLNKPRPVSGSSTINQFVPAISLTLEFLESLTIKGTYTYYLYDRDVNGFLNTLNSPRAVATGASGFATAISGFPTSETEIDINWFPFENWEFDEEATDTISATDGSHGYTFKEIALATVFSDWKFGLSYEYEQSETLNDHVYSAIIKWSSD